MGIEFMQQLVCYSNEYKGPFIINLSSKFKCLFFFIYDVMASNLSIIWPCHWVFCFKWHMAWFVLELWCNLKMKWCNICVIKSFILFAQNYTYYQALSNSPDSSMAIGSSPFNWDPNIIGEMWMHYRYILPSRLGIIGIMFILQKLQLWR